MAGRTRPSVAAASAQFCLLTTVSGTSLKCCLARYGAL